MIELEKRLIKMAIDAMSKQMSAMAKCIEMCSKNVDKSVSTTTNFAPTLFEYVSRETAHLEPINRISPL